MLRTNKSLRDQREGPYTVSSFSLLRPWPTLTHPLAPSLVSDDILIRVALRLSGRVRLLRRTVVGVLRLGASPFRLSVRSLFDVHPHARATQSLVQHHPAAPPFVRYPSLLQWRILY